MLLSVSCSLNEEIDANDTVNDMSDWTEDTHGSSVPPNYDVVFSEDEVLRIDLVIDSDDWQDMLDDMKENYGSFGTGGGMGPGMMGSSENPIFVPCSLFFEGKEWYRVGVRFKGNSSLRSAWGEGIWKLALKLDFNEFEEEYPEIEGQRFYGFRQLALGNNFHDASFIRERVVPEIFREMGVRAPHTAYYRVYIDHGEGSIYFGLYTAVEVVDDTMLEDQFGSDNGNCYKPEGNGAAFAFNSFNQADFEKKNNEAEADWSDIIALFDALHSDDRFSNYRQWKNGLEEVFNVDGFLRWLAVNTVIQNWDTYGKMNHNYYLYNDPSGLGITWIPWDNNEALNEGKQDGSLSIALTEVSARWPLIRYLMDDEDYRALYSAYVEETINSAFEPTKMIARYRRLHDLVQPYVTGSEGENDGYTFLRSDSEFYSGLDYLISHVSLRKAEAENYIDQQ
jgi:spore coat protein CotH